MMEEDVRKETLKRVAHELAMAGQKQNAPLSEEQIATLLIQKLMTVIPEVTEVRPQSLECDVVRFQNNKEKWVALVGLLDGYPYEIFTGLQDDEEGIVLPKNVVHGKITMTSSSRTSVDTRRRLRACRRSSTPNIGTMRRSSRVCFVTVCR